MTVLVGLLLASPLIAFVVVLALGIAALWDEDSW